MVRETIQSNKIILAIASVAILALIISLVALQRTQRPNSSQSQFESLQSELRVMREQAQLEQARQRLEEVRRNVVQGTNPEQMRSEVTDIREYLRRNFVTAGEQAEEMWRPIDRELEKIEGELREGSVNALNTIDGLLEKLKKEIRYDEK